MTPARFLPLALACLLHSAAAADDWPKLLFKTTSHDFGTVARGAVAEHRFQMENPYVEDVHIERIKSSCGCTNPTVTKPLLKTWQSGEIVATLDTRRHLGQKDATLTVHFDQPFRATFDLKVTSYIRGDVVFEPGDVQFGSVPQGQSVKKRVSVAYAGRPAWKVLEAGTDSPYLDLQIAEVARAVDPQTNVGKVTYDLWVALKEAAPTGYFKDIVVLKTNDPNVQTSRIPLTVEGLVVPSLTVNPAVIMFGVVQAGQSVSKNVVLRGQKPFRVVEVEGPDPRFRFTVPQTASDRQIIIVEFQAPDSPAKISGKIRIKTDLGGAGPMEVSVDGQVAAKSPPNPKRDPTPAAAKEPAGR